MQLLVIITLLLPGTMVSIKIIFTYKIFCSKTNHQHPKSAHHSGSSISPVQFTLLHWALLRCPVCTPIALCPFNRNSELFNIYLALFPAPLPFLFIIWFLTDVVNCKGVLCVLYFWNCPPEMHRDDCAVDE